MITLLIIDDDAMTSRMYEKAFALDRHKVIVANSAEDGLQKARTESLDVILLDIMMPKKSGLAVLKELKAHPETRTIPVIILTNLDKNKDIEAALSMGAVKYLVKAEHTPKEIVQQVEEALSASN